MPWDAFFKPWCWNLLGCTGVHEAQIQGCPAGALGATYLAAAPSVALASAAAGGSRLLLHPRLLHDAPTPRVKAACSAVQ